MPWFYVDDGFSDSKPVLNLPERHRLACIGLWTLAGSWSAKEELDGFVPDSKLRQLGAKPRLVDALCEPGPLSAPLWTRVEGGIRFNSWEKWQKTRAELAEKRRKDAERQRAHRSRKNKGRNAVTSTDVDVSRRDTDVTNGGVTHALVTRDPHARAHRPDPTRPINGVNSLDHSSALNVGGERASETPAAPAETVAAGDPDTVLPRASRLVSTLVPLTIPAPVRTQLRLQASQLMHRDGLDADTVAEALRRWTVRPEAGPGLLPHLAADVVRERQAPAGSSKLRAYVDLAARMRAEENQPDPEPEVVE